MRLLKATTLDLEEVLDNDVPKYAILSHTWGNEEVTLQELQTQEAKTKAGYDKIKEAARLTLADGLDYVWIDTCCIDKTSSAELSEAINSMMRYYELAEVCYAYVEDCPLGVAAFGGNKHKWFTRGWTLQELIAPRRLRFYGTGWCYLGSREMLVKEIYAITGIDEQFLQRCSREGSRGQDLLGQRTGDALRAMLDSVSVAQRMSWASERETKRAEDGAYCLMGIFGVNMPLLYGEGGERAFFRLQEEIMKYSDDYSILAWNLNPTNPISPDQGCPGARVELSQCTGALAASPSQFLGCQKVKLINVGDSVPPFSLTNKGLHIEMRAQRLETEEILAILPCRLDDDHSKILALHLARSPDGIYGRSRAYLTLVEKSEWDKWRPTMLYLLSRGAAGFGLLKPNESAIIVKSLSHELRIVDVWCSAFGRKSGSQFIISKENAAQDQLAAVLVSGSQDWLVLLALSSPTGGSHDYCQSTVCRLVGLSGNENRFSRWQRLIWAPIPQDHRHSESDMDLEKLLKKWSQKPLHLSDQDWEELSDQAVTGSKVYFVNTILGAQLGEKVFSVEIDCVSRRFANIRHHQSLTNRAARTLLRGYLAGQGHGRKIFWLLLLLPRIPTTVIEFFCRIGMNSLDSGNRVFAIIIILLFELTLFLSPSLVYFREELWLRRGVIIRVLRKLLWTASRAGGRVALTTVSLYSFCRIIASDTAIDWVRGLDVSWAPTSYAP
jgi:hypothetical protein